MSKSLIPFGKSKKRGVVREIKTDLGTAGIAAATIVGYSVIPLVGWLVGIGGVGYIIVRAARRGLDEDDKR